MLQINTKIKAGDPDIKEEDILYHAFSSEYGGSSAFMRTWLHLFARMYHKIFTTLSAKYFNSKGMTLNTWMEGIINEHKGDVLVLHGLCLLIENWKTCKTCKTHFA